MTELAPFMGPEEAASLLRCTQRTIEDRLRSGDLPGEKFGEGWIIPTQALLLRVNEIATEKMRERRQVKPVGLVKVQSKDGGRRPPELG